MIFASDNWAGVHQAISERLAQEAGGFSVAYGDSQLDKAIEQRFKPVV